MNTPRPTMIGFLAGVSLGAVVSSFLTIVFVKRDKELYSSAHLTSSAALVDSVHSALVLSEIPASPKRSFGYLGATRFDRRPRGYYQYLTSTWEIFARDEHDVEHRIWLSLSPDGKSGVPVNVRHIGTVKLVVATDGDRHAPNGPELVLDLGYGAMSIRKSLDIIFGDFMNLQLDPSCGSQSY